MSLIVVFDIDGVIRDVSQSYRRAIADTVEFFTKDQYRPSMADMDELKSEGMWNNDWQASQELIYRYCEQLGQSRQQLALDYEHIVRFFQSRYRGQNWDGYITTEPLLLQAKYLETLTTAGISWGFFSGATRGSAEYVLKTRLGLENPLLIAMEDAPGKPNPTGLFKAVQLVEAQNNHQVVDTIIYVGDTVGDMLTVEKAKEIEPHRRWLGVGVKPPHIQNDPTIAQAYSQKLTTAGAIIVLNNVEQLTPVLINQLVM